MTVAIYARYSSELQDARSVEDQVARLRERIARDGGDLSTVREYKDEATSGATWERKELQKLLLDIASGKVRTLYVESIDRLSRDVGDAARIRKRLEFHGVHLRSIGDGIELDGKGSAGALAYDVKTIIAEMYLRDLADKTLRGLQGRAREGKATGGRTYGYDTAPDGSIVVDDGQAAIVRRMFAMFAEGASYATIAKALNDEGVPPPRGHARRRGDGWMASGIREMLCNARYVGDWSFGRRRWRKDPETRRRTPVARDTADVIEVKRPDLAIIDAETWLSARARFARQKEIYGSTTRAPRKSGYLLTSLLVCDVCGSPMEIAGGGPGRAVYRCAANRKRGTCANRLSVRESIARTCILAAIRTAVATDDAIAYVRQQAAILFGEQGRAATREIDERRGRLQRTEERVRGLILMQAEGDRSAAVAELRRDLEAAAEVERGALEAVRANASAPVRIPSPEEISARVFNFERRLGRDVLAAREALRRLLHRGEIRLRPTDAGHYEASGEVMPLVLLVDAETERQTPPGSDTGRRCPNVVAGARYPLWASSIVVPYRTELLRTG